MPRIGLLSDSHSRAATTRRAVALLLEQGVDILIHLGDIESLDVIDALVVPRKGGDRQIEAHLTFGNVDWDVRGMGAYAREVGIQIGHPVGRLDLGEGKVLVYLHGHDARALAEALAEGVAYLCHGHTHQRSDRRQGSTRIINPGALFRCVTHTVAVLDTANDQLEFLEVSA